MSVNTYSAKKVSVIVGGIPMHGFTEDSVVMIEQSAEAFKMLVGADGEVGRSYNPDRSGKITIHLNNYSDSNDVLSGLAIADAATLIGTFPVMVKDNNGTTLAASAEAWISKIPNTEFKREIGQREWVIECAQLQYYAGGSF